MAAQWWQTFFSALPPTKDGTFALTRAPHVEDLLPLEDRIASPGDTVLSRLRNRSTPFAWVTTLAAGVIAATGLVDLFSGSVNFSSGWTWVWFVVCVAMSALPAILGERFPHVAGLAGCIIFGAVTVLQTAQSTDVIMAVNNLVLYPMIACYLGWFFDRWLARGVVIAMFGASGLALFATTDALIFTSWFNLALASLFTLEAAVFLRTQLARQIETDPLTGALNRIGLDKRLRHEMIRAARIPTPLSIAVVDLDKFKAVNDELGHLAGDHLLQDFALTLRSELRPYDVVARVGGDEFVVVLPSVTAADATSTLERLRSRSSVPWTFGVAEAHSGDSQESLMRRADQELYFHKRRRAS